MFRGRLWNFAKNGHRLKWTNGGGLNTAPIRFNSIKTNPKTKKPENNNFGATVKPRLIIFGVAAGLYFASESPTVNHAVLTMERVGVVTVATMRCFRLYWKTLQREYEDVEAKQRALDKCHKHAAEITLRALETNGGIYIKFGQHISAMTYLLPKEWTETMIPLQNRCPQSSMEELRKMFRDDMDMSLDEMFSEFDPNPIGVASLAQVHMATLRETGERVAVKLQHPKLEEFVPVDIYMTQNVFNLMNRFFPEYPMSWLGDELQSSIYIELDFRKEAENAAKSAKYFENFENQTALRIPTVYSAKPRILVMEFVEGARLDDIDYLDRNGISRSEVSSCLSHIFNNMIFTPGVGIHCDPHGGNLAVRKSSDPKKKHNFEIVLYDHGLYRDVPSQMRRDYAKFWLAMLDSDKEAMRIYADKFAGVSGNDFEIFAAAITGRDFEHALSGVKTQRTKSELNNMAEALTSGGLFVDLMSLLSKLPRVVLLILKTNDLTRHLDEGLQNPLGPERTFLILATYCAKTVYEEDKEKINNERARWSLKWFVGMFGAWIKYHKRTNQLLAYDLAMMMDNLRKRVSF